MSISWPDEIFTELQAAQIRQVAYVPDAGHSQLLQRCHANLEMHTVSLTTEEEGVAMLAGAWLGGDRGVLLMQSSGVGNCINMLAVNQECRIPLLMLVTMRGEWGEFNPWQVPMGQATRAEPGSDRRHRLPGRQPPTTVAETVRAAAMLAFQTYRAVAVLIAQRVIGAKQFEK